MPNSGKWRCNLFFVMGLAASAMLANGAIVSLTGSSFHGGAAERYGHSYQGTKDVNFVYAKPSGPLSKMTASFDLSAAPTEKMVIQIRGRDDDGRSPTHIEIAINDEKVFSSESGFPHNVWGTRRFEIPSGALKAGENKLTISNIETSGGAGNRPWFMLSRATLAAPGALPIEHFQVQLPAKVEPFAQPAADSAPRFKFRGTKGYAWTAEQYLAEIPYLKKSKMNFLMNGYLSMFDHKTGKNLWWEPFSAQRKASYAKVVKACQDAGITFCFAMHPQLGSPRPLNLSSEKDFDDFFRHFAWMQSLGVHWFAVSMDDVGGANQAQQQARFSNKFLAKLREKDPSAQLLFTPTVYATAMMHDHGQYLKTLGRVLDKDIYVFWTGPDVVSLTISREDAEYYKNLVHHRLFIWDNYPVNDGSPTLHLGPITGRDPELCQVAVGYMANPMRSEIQIDRVPLYTMADYAYNPDDYDPMRSIGQAIMHLAGTVAQQRAMANLVELYPGDIIYGEHGTNFNPVMYEYGRLTTGPSGQMLGAIYLHGLQKVLDEFRAAFPSEYTVAADLLARDITQLRNTQQMMYPSN